MSEIVARDFGELRRLIASGKVNLSEVMERLAPPVEPPAEAEVKLPKPVVLSDADRKALRTLPAKLAEVELPGMPRRLTQEERNVLVPLFDQIKVAVAAVKKAEEAFKEAMHNHLDAVADEGTPVGKNGHLLSEGEVVADDYAKKVVRGLVGGNAVELTTVDLEELVNEGKISLAQYRKWTKAVTHREVIPSAVMADLAKNGELLDVIASKARRTDQTTAIRMAKN